MARSHDDPMNDSLNVTFDRDELPEGQARFVIREQAVTTVIQGDADTVRQRFYDHLDEDLGTDGEEIEAYPMPDSDEGLVSAEEFYSDGEA